MRSKLKIFSLVLLMAMLLSLVPAAGLPTPAAASSTCDWAQFVADVTVPDGTSYAPGTAFKKTWRLKNIGTCTWTTGYALVFDSGEKFGAPATINFPINVAPGQTVDLSVDMTAPGSAGHYFSYWKLRNASGVIFGIGATANKAFWAEINVTSTSGTGYDFAANAASATWTSGAGALAFPGTDGSANGFAFQQANPKFESGLTSAQAGLLFSPNNVTNGYIQAIYPAFRVNSGDRFQATIGCEYGATTCYAEYRLMYQVGSGAVTTYWTFREKYEGLTYNVNLDLSRLAGQDVKFILYVNAYGSPAGDRALWGGPVIARAGGTPPTLTPVVTVTGTPPTATPTKSATVPPSSCDRAQFVADVTVPDGTSFAPGIAFTKTWRLKNIGSCTWTTAYSLMFDSGEKMGGPDTAAMPTNVAPGQTVDITINLTSPTTAGTYRGYWKFKNASGVPFGIGTAGTKSWWVEIKVAGTGTVPSTPVTPSTPVAGSSYDFAANACAAVWYSGSGQLPCPGSEGDARGFMLKQAAPKLENGVTDSRPGLLTVPQNVTNGYIQGFYPPYTVKSGDRFRATIGCENGATSCYVVFRLDYQIGSGSIQTLWAFVEKYEGQVYEANVDLSPLVGQNVKFILTILATGSPTGDRALWTGPIVYNPSAATAVPPTPTLPLTGTPSATTAPPTSTSVPSTPTPTNTTVPPSETPTPTATTAP